MKHIPAYFSGEKCSLEIKIMFYDSSPFSSIIVVAMTILALLQQTRFHIWLPLYLSNVNRRKLSPPPTTPLFFILLHIFTQGCTTFGKNSHRIPSSEMSTCSPGWLIDQTHCVNQLVPVITLVQLVSVVKVEMQLRIVSLAEGAYLFFFLCNFFSWCTTSRMTPESIPCSRICTCTHDFCMFFF